MTTSLALASKLATQFGLDSDPAEVMTVLKNTAFKGNVSNDQMTALLIVANQYKLNPWTKEIYAFPDKNNGIVPVVGLDGWSRIINEHPQFDGMEAVIDGDGMDMSVTVSIYRKDRSKPTTITEYYSECKREAGPWKSHPKRMLRHKGIIQCARLAFGFAGIYDEDEAERIREAKPSVVLSESMPEEEIEAFRIQGRQATTLDELLDVFKRFSNAASGYKDLSAQASFKDFMSQQRQRVESSVADVDAGVVGEGDLL